MKWVKTAIGAVIAILSVGIIATSVYSMTQETVKEEVVTFEIETYDDLTNKGSVTEGTFDNIISLVQVDEHDEITNILSIKLNGVEEENIYSLQKIFNDIIIVTDNIDIQPLRHDDTYDDLETFILKVGDEIVIIFEVTTPPVVSGVTATLLGLSSLVFASAILFSIYNFRKEGGL